jgi:hypothetical protein
MPPNFSNRSAIRFMILWSAVVSPEGRKRYRPASCSLLALSTSSIVGNPFTPAPLFSTLTHLKRTNVCQALTRFSLETCSICGGAARATAAVISTDDPPQPGSHLRKCRQRSARFEQLRQTFALLDNKKSPEHLPYFDTRLEGAVPGRREKRQRRSEAAPATPPRDACYVRGR